MKGIHFVYTWVTLLFLFELYQDVTESCTHNKVRYHNMVETHITKLLCQSFRKDHRVKRDSAKVYRPIRITTLYNMVQFLSTAEQESLKQVVERAVRKMSSLLSVIREKGPLLLQRDACHAILRSGINKGKCSRIQKGYSGEKCIDNFKIPSAHLEGFEVYNRSHEGPTNVYFEDGPGLEDTDFVLYVTSKTMTRCNPYKTSALAYAAYCKLDNSGRPVAGQVNFCPRTVKAQKFDENMMYKTAIHELFHALGFSNKLFEKFKKCNNESICEPWPQPILKPVDGTMRLVTDAVVREMRNHFNCNSEADFGGPLEVINGSISSHWNPLLMHSSVMGSKEQKPYLALIDPVSLAVLEDSGWYRVNYSRADKFIWGKGQGCSFGLKDSCGHQKGFCTQNITGCHHLRLSKARCNINLNSLSVCGVFAADQKPCFVSSPNISSSSSSSSIDETFSPSSRCFLSSLTPSHSHNGSYEYRTLNTTGRCYERKCEKDKFYLRVEGGKWILCHPGSHIQVEGYEGQVHCPTFEEICSDFMYPDVPVQDVTTSTTTVTTTLVQSSTKAMPTSMRPCKPPVCQVINTNNGTASFRFCLAPIAALVGILASISEYLLP